MESTRVSKHIGSDALFTQYVEVVNRVIGENREGLYGSAVKLWDKLYADDEIAVGVYRKDAAHPHHWYTVKLSAGTFEVLEHGKSGDADVEWKVSDQHLAHVVDNPRDYVASPFKLDLDWLQTRVGLA